MKRLLTGLAATLIALGALPAEAHRISTRGGPPPDGISIPSLTHGQMAVISDNLSVDPRAGQRADRLRHDDMAA